MIKFKYYKDKKGKYYFIPITVRFRKEIAELQKVLDKNKKNKQSNIYLYILCNKPYTINNG